MPSPDSWITIALAAMTAIMAYARLEVKVKVLERDFYDFKSWKDKALEVRLSNIEKNHSNLNLEVMEKLSNIEKMVAKIEVKLELNS